MPCMMFWLTDRQLRDLHPEHAPSLIADCDATGQLGPSASDALSQGGRDELLRASQNVLEGYLVPTGGLSGKRYAQNVS